MKFHPSHRPRSRWVVLGANLLWLGSALPGLARFLASALWPRWAQKRLALRALEQAEGTAHAQALGLSGGVWPESLEIQGPESLEAWGGRLRQGEALLLTRDPVLGLMPTSGSSGASRLVPYTRALLGQFQSALDPWLALLYLARPSLLWRRQYWSLSPATSEPLASVVPVGFREDTAYLNRWQRAAAPALMAVPADAAGAKEGFERATLLHLLACEDLGFVSVWSPTFFLVLLDALSTHRDGLLEELAHGAPERARSLGRLDLEDPGQWRQLWPQLRVISCWTDAAAAPEALRLARLFPKARVQAKGLMATEAVVSFPLGLSGRRVLAAGSHYFEFVAEGNGPILQAWQLETGRDYRVLVSTCGGLLRHDLRDRVRVTGWFLRLPCLEFIGREDLVSDWVGEKLHGRHAQEAVGAAAASLGLSPGFALLAPRKDGGRRRYCLYAAVAPASAADFARALEARLRSNYHYRHARGLGQLEAVEVCAVMGDPAATVLRRLADGGRRLGDIKLDTLSQLDGWETLFQAAGGVGA